MHIREVAPHALDLRTRLRIVDVNSHEYVEALVFESVDGVCDHGRDHLGFAPRRHHDRDGFLRGPRKLVARRWAPQQQACAFDEHEPPIGEIDEEVIERRKKDDDGGDSDKSLQYTPIGARGG